MQAHEQLGARRVESRERLVEQQHAGVLDERAGDEHALALAARQVAEGLLRLVGQADAGERPPRARARSPRPGRRHHGSRDTAPMSATSSALTGKSRRERSVWGTTPQRGGASTRPRPARARR